MIWKGVTAIIVSMNVWAALVAAEPKKFVKVEYFLNKKILYTEESFQNGTILYNSCDIDKSSKTDLTCEVIQQSRSFNGTERRLVCPLSLVDVDDRFIRAYSAGRDRAVIVYIDSKTAPVKKYLQLLNVDLASCKSTRNEVAIPPTDLHGSSWNIRLITVLPYGDRYDVIFNYQFSCNAKLCKGTYDLDGNVVAELSGWDQVAFKKFSTVFATVNHYSTADGYLIIYKENKTVAANLIQDDTKLLKSWDLEAVNVTPNIIYATNAGAIAICLQFNQTARCSFFDWTGNAKQTTDLESGEEQLYAVYNLADGFLIMSQACFDPNFKNPVVFCKNQKFFVKRYDSRGKLVKKVPVDDFKWDNFEYIVFGRFFQNETGEYCASLASYLFELQPPKVDVPQSVELAVQCFTEL